MKAKALFSYILFSYVLLVTVFLFMLMSCFQYLTDDTDDIKNDTIALFHANENLFIEASTSEDYSEIEKINGVEQVSVRNNYIDIYCAGSGFGSSTHYYGIFFSLSDDLCAIDVAGPADELFEDGKGYRYKPQGGDNEYYVEPLGNHYFYYEAHF